MKIGLCKNLVGKIKTQPTKISGPDLRRRRESISTPVSTFHRRPCCSSLLLSAVQTSALCGYVLHPSQFRPVGGHRATCARVPSNQYSLKNEHFGTKSKWPPKNMLQWLPGQSRNALHGRTDEELAESQLSLGIAAFHTTTTTASRM